MAKPSQAGRIPIEAVLALVLAGGVGTAVLTRVVAGREPPSIEESFRAGARDVEDQLGCLKTALEAPVAGEPGETPATDDAVERIARAVERIRELRYTTLPEATFLTRAELAERAAGFVEAYPDDEASADEEALADLGALPQEADLKEMLGEALAGQVAGFYDTETKELVVTGDPDDLDPIGEMTLAHELEHALADQALGIPAEDEPPDGQEDANLAATALVEGDATLTMLRYSFDAELGDVLTDAFAGVPDALVVAQSADLPHYLQRSLEFPYDEGMAFVCELYAHGGWEAVDDAYADPPVATAQVLFPERYLAGEEPIEPSPSVSPGEAWTLEDVDGLGAADLLFLFEAPADEPERGLEDPVGRASAWGGGRLDLWAWRGGVDHATAMLLVEREEGPDLCGSMGDWYRAAFVNSKELPALPGERMAMDGYFQDAVLRCAGAEVRLAIAQDVGTARALLGG